MTRTQPTPDLVDIHEIAARLDVKPDTVYKWRYRQLLPTPDFNFAYGPLWQWETIRAWAEATGRLERT